MGTLYIGIHSVAQFIMSVYYANYYVDKHYNFNEEEFAHLHHVHYNVIHYYMNPVILIPLLINFTLAISSFVGYFMTDHVRDANFLEMLKSKSLQNTYYEGNEQFNDKVK